ncbi:hypothetical protein RI129_011280 [Pyrocoelia pectoralis]|uniref:Uncharacterized protein n=1 Tax=Pyrocoelia pectoralis TaxID=417401 RepID=A0AAN7VAV6_9COLE
MWLILILLLTIFLLLLWYVDTRKPNNFPPGPKWLPIIGCAWELRNLHKAKGTLSEVTQELAAKYGSVVGVKVGRKLTVFVYGSTAFKELLSKDDFNARPDDIFATSRTFGKRREQKKFLIHQLKEIGFHKPILEEILAEEMRAIIHDINKTIEDDGVICVTNLFPVHILNTLHILMTGDKCSDQEMEELHKAMNSFSENIPLTGMLFNHFPFLRYICPDYCGYNTYVNIHKRVLAFISKKVKMLKEICGPQLSRGFIHAYLEKLNVVKGKSSFSEEQLLATCLDVLTAGFDTTCNSLGFVFLYLLLHPEVQQKAQEEIDSVIGRGRPPTSEDRPRLPYVECVVFESLRLITGRAFVVPRRAIRDSTLNGYFIPKGTILQGSARGTFLDESAGWKNPEVFNPERFMKDGMLCIPDNFIPFGSGRRRCVGEIMARANIFVIVASLLQTFNFRSVPGSPPKVDFVEGFTPSVKPFKAFVTLR